MKQTYKHILPLVLLSIYLIGCGTIHEYPDAETDVELTLTYSFHKPGDLEEVQYPLNLRNLANDWRPTKRVRYTVEIYRTDDLDNGNPIARETYYSKALVDNEIVSKFILPTGSYKTLAWVDHIMHENTKDLFYNTGQLTNVNLLNQYGGDRSKEAFGGKKDIVLTGDSDKREERMLLERPSGGFRIVSTDYDKYTDSGKKPPKTAIYNYKNSYFSSYHTADGKVENRASSILFDYQVVEFTNNECTVALDWLLTQTEGHNVSLSLSILDEDGELINEIPNITFPLKRDKLIILRAPFLTEQIEQEGIIIDEGFEEEIEITLD